MVSGSIDDNHCMITIDTGSTITIVCPGVLSKEKRQHLQPVSGWLRTVTGEKVPFKGKSELALKIGTTLSSQQAWVAKIQDECILGMDFLRPHGCLVNLQDDTLRIDDEEVPLLRPTPAGLRQSCFRAVLEETIDLPPHSESVIPVRVEGLVHDSERLGILESDGEKPHSSNGLMTGRTLVDLREPLVPVRVTNLTEHPQRVKKGSVMAVGEVVQSVLVTDVWHCKKIREDKRTVPDHLQDLYQRSTSGLNPDQQQQVHSLLCEFCDLFSQGPQDLGRTNAVQH